MSHDCSAYMALFPQTALVELQHQHKQDLSKIEKLEAVLGDQRLQLQEKEERIKGLNCTIRTARNSYAKLNKQMQDTVTDNRCALELFAHWIQCLMQAKLQSNSFSVSEQ